MGSREVVAGLTKSSAEEILDCMGASGQPPEHGLEFVTVGLDKYLQIIENEYFRRFMKEAGGSAFRLIQGSYGSGKTHFLHCVRSMAQRLGFLTCSVNLTPQECPYEDALRVYQAAFSKISLCCSADGPLFPDGAEETEENGPAGNELITVSGFAGILRLAASRKDDGGAGLAASFDAIPVENYTFRRVCQRFIEACRCGRSDEEEALEMWLSGRTCGGNELLHRLGIFDVITTNNAFPVLLSMVNILTGIGFPGVVFLFDEVDIHVASAGAKRLRAIGDTLRQIIDLCASSRLPRVLFFYAVPPDFMNSDVPNYPALQQRLARPLSMSLSSPQSVVIDLEGSSENGRVFFKELGLRLIRVAELAWDWNIEDPAALEANLDIFAGFMDNEVFTGGYRTFVKFWIDILRSQHIEGQSPITEDGLRELLQESEH